MTKCWQEDPDARPTFADLRNQLKEMENQHKVNPSDDIKKLSACFFYISPNLILQLFR